VAWLLTRWVTGQDIRQMGSGNVGVMNTALSATRWAGLLVFACEIAKGVLAVAMPRALGADPITIGLTVLASVVGTRWSVWLDFTGGRGNTCAISALGMICWQSVVVLVGVWALMRMASHKSFIATRITFMVLPIVLGALTSSWWYALFGAGLSLVYLCTTEQKKDDHSILKEQWPSLWAFLTSPKRS
jgi:glycerol-3-phosphate acyltransferase PlsY